MGLDGRHEVRQQQPRALLEDTGLQSRPTTDGSIEIPTTDARVTCANGPISHLSPPPDREPQRTPQGISTRQARLCLKKNQSGSCLHWYRRRLRPRRQPGQRASGSRLAMHRHTRKYRRAARLGCNGARWPTRSSTAATTGFVRGHRAPVTTNNRRLHRDSHHRCTRMCKRPNLPPVPRSSPASSKPQLRT
jgi:hypothetical protein